MADKLVPTPGEDAISVPAEVFYIADALKKLIYERNRWGQRSALTLQRIHERIGWWPRHGYPTRKEAERVMYRLLGTDKLAAMEKANGKLHLEVFSTSEKMSWQLDPPLPPPAPVLTPEEEMEARILEKLFAGLTLEQEGGDFTMPNNRTIKLMFNGKEIASTTIDVVQQREYEG